ncbi:MAG: hypothetical protein VKL59_02215 [Nostocaceae cyanobacterium]|nr:hypothetical protein [Nostocaceae cyanobacterium]
MRYKPLLTFTLTTLFLGGLGFFTSGLGEFSLIPQPVIAQTSISVSDSWRRVYEQLPDLPLENQYVSKETGQVAKDNTLISRLIRYHTLIKGRAPNYRLDWKLTLADYLQANEVMYANAYPGNDTLRQNPLEGDRNAIERLNRKQRNALVEVLVSIFTRNSRNRQSRPSDSTPQPEETTPTLPSSPQPGDAQLLR